MKKSSDEKTLKSEALSLFSILTLIFAFAFVCAACLFVLWRFDAFEIPWTERAERPLDPADAEYDDVVKALHTKNASGGEVSRIKDDYEIITEKILTSLGKDSFYIYCEVLDIGAGDTEPYSYDLWRCDDKYRVTKYDSGKNVLMDIVCNGKIVNATYLGEGKRVFTINEASFERFSPLPDLSMLLDEECRPIYSNASDGEYQIICECGGTDVIDVRLNMSLGLISSIKLFRDSQPTVSVDVFSSAIDISPEDFLN